MSDEKPISGLNDADAGSLIGDAERKRRRDDFLAELAEAHELRLRVAPRRARMARLRQQQLMRTFFY